MLVTLLLYLHGLMESQDSAFEIMSSQIRNNKVNGFDASNFLCHQFPTEYARLDEKMRHVTAVALLMRANNFALAKKYKREVYLQCSSKWALFLFFIINGSYPFQDDMSICVDSLASSHCDQSQGIDYAKILQGSPVILLAAVMEDPTVLQLYGSSHAKASIGQARLMIAGAAWHHLVQQHGTQDIDSLLTDPFLAYLGFSMGIMAPTAIDVPLFQSNIVPIHFCSHFMKQLLQ